MPRFAANLSMMFLEYAFMDRFAAASATGFDAVEYLFPYEFDMSQIALSLQENHLTQALFNLPPDRAALCRSHWGGAASCDERHRSPRRCRRACLLS